MEIPADPRSPLHPKCSQKPSNRLSNEFSELLAKAGLRKSPRSRVKTGAGHQTRRKPSEVGFHSLRVTTTSLLDVTALSPECLSAKDLGVGTGP